MFPSRAGKALLLFQNHPKWVRQGRADSKSTSAAAAVPVCVCVCVLTVHALFALHCAKHASLLHTHTHTQRDDTTENKREKNHSLSVSVQLFSVERTPAAEQLDLRSYGSDACYFPRKPPAAAKPPLRFPRNKEVACRNMQRFCCKKPRVARLGEVQAEQRLDTPSVIGSV